MHQIHGAPARLSAALSFLVPRRAAAVAAATLLAAFAGSAQASCGAAFCSINTDWTSETTGLAEGSVFDLRYEHIRQDQPRAGSRRIGVGEIRAHHDEVSTLNRNLVATFTHTFANGFGLSVSAPYLDRDHVHIHNHRGAQLVERWDFREFGDVRITGRYQRALGGSDSAPRTGGVILGLKLPTGRTNVANTGGDIAERTLQPGTGTTDLILGAVFHQQIPASGASWFAQAQVQQPLNSHDDFRPGAQLTADVGYAHPLGAKLDGILQLNVVAKRRDRGAEAESANSGSRAVFLSPGASLRITDAVRVYGFVQQPLYQYVNGVQLTPKRAFVVGVSTRF